MAARRLGHSAASASVLQRGMADLPQRGRVLLRGYVDSVTVLPVTDSPCFSAVVTDLEAGGTVIEAGVSNLEAGHARRASRSPVPAGGRPSAAYPGGPQSCRVRLIWLGQRTVPGIEAGIRMTFEGMVAQIDAIPTIYNPRYEIIGRPKETDE